MNFQDALTAIQSGKQITRTVWKDKSRYCFIYPESDNINLQYLVGKLVRREACRVGHYTHMNQFWHPTVDDILATDWELV